MCRTFASSSSELEVSTRSGTGVVLAAPFGSSVLDPQPGSDAEESNLHESIHTSIIRFKQVYTNTYVPLTTLLGVETTLLGV